MTKKQLLATLAVSTLALAQAGVVSADETTTSPVDGTTPVVVSPAETPVDQAQPSQPVETPPITEPTTPPATEAPVDPTTPTQPSENPTTPPTTEPATPAPSDPADPSTTTPSTPSEEPKSDDSTQPSGEPTSPSDGNGQTTPEPTGPSTGEVPKDVKPMPEPVVTFNPFETPSGQTVVGTQNSQVIVQNADGSTQTVKAEDVGGTTNSDGTVTLPTASGEAKTLPQTGEEGSLLSAIGLGLLSLVGFIFKKKAI
ncbi:LPXTG cell wall anchor domain-containing protein [Streptococcus agalactiae]|uniref:LPXTG cell wall anchor domain-containing protein n=1 Tax=Streptococcus agalactiae TaxID=1311 RepID=UPI00085C3D2B|nr:LPXTG cell wall anchor domain-containing protein [Streptococcus agalactiae]